MQRPYFLERCLHRLSIQTCCPRQLCDFPPPSANEWQIHDCIFENYEAGLWGMLFTSVLIQVKLWLHTLTENSVLWTTQHWRNRCSRCSIPNSTLKAQEVQWHHLTPNIRSPRSHGRGPMLQIPSHTSTLQDPRKVEWSRRKRENVSREHPLCEAGEKFKRPAHCCSFLYSDRIEDINCELWYNCSIDFMGIPNSLILSQLGS